MEDGNDNETLSRIAGDDRQRGIHRGGATNADRRQLAEILRQQRRTQQGKNLTADVGKQSYGSQLGTPILSDEDTGQRVVSEARTDGKTVGEQAMSQSREAAAHPARVPRMVITGNIISRGFTFLKLFNTEVSQPILIPTQNIRQQSA